MTTTKNIHRSTHPETGQVATRCSKTRTYSHAVWVRRPAGLDRQEDELNLSTARRRLSEYAAVVAAGAVPDLHTPDGPRPSLLTVEDYVGFVAHEHDRIARLEARLAEDDYPESEWGVAAWTGRLGLAAKQAGAYRTKGYEVEIVKAELEVK